MNDVLFPKGRWRRRGREAMKRVVLRTANSLALGGLCAWAVNEQLLRIERKAMPIVGLGEELDGLRILHLSDLHVSPLVSERYLRRSIRLVNHLRPDVVVITGDFISGFQHYARRAGAALSHLHPRIAALACLGNHDYGIWHPSGPSRERGQGRYMAQQLENAGVHVLLNESWTLRRGGGILQFVGLEDYWTGRYSPKAAFESVDVSQPIIALCHNPDAAPELAEYGAQWILSGHTHGCTGLGRKLHEWVLPVTNKRFIAGHYPVNETSHVYINCGLGHAMRRKLNSRPEITIFELKAMPAAVAKA